MRNTRAWPALGAAVALLLGVAGCVVQSSSAEPQSPSTASAPTAPCPAAPADPTASEPAREAVRFEFVVDGDTIGTSAGTVRLIGIDTPERGECGHDEASAEIGRLLAGGDPVVLELPSGQNDHDRHGRLIRYVITRDGVDLGLLQLESGHALAKYDSRDGYPAHPHEAAYHAAQLASPGPDGSVVTTACRDGILPAADLPPDHWWEGYPSCAKLKRNTAGHPTGPFARDDPAQAEIYDWFAHRTGHAGDGDGDGLACE